MSKFTSAIAAAKDRSAAVLESLEAAPEPTPTPAPAPPHPSPILAESPPSPRRGRPAGKRSSTDTVQVTAYIQTETHYATKLALLVNSRKGGPRQDFSDLVQTLLERWLTSHK